LGLGEQSHKRPFLGISVLFLALEVRPRAGDTPESPPTITIPKRLGRLEFRDGATVRKTEAMMLVG